MAPKTIEGSIIKNRKAITNEVVSDLICDGGVERVRDLLTDKWKHNPDDVIVVPTLTINTAGKISGAKWHVLGKLTKDVNIKLTQLNSEADDDAIINIKNLELGIFPFYNKRRNVSGWIDSEEVDFSVVRKEGKKKVTVKADQLEDAGFKGFSLRIGVMPVAPTKANIVLAIHPLGKEGLKDKVPDGYYKNACPQVALGIGDSNAKFLCVSMGVQEPASCEFGMGILPVIEDLRSEGEIASLFPSSWDIRSALFNFMRTVKGFNNKSVKKIMEAMDDIETELSRSLDPEFVWPECVASEGDEPVEDELGKWHKVQTV